MNALQAIINFYNESTSQTVYYNVAKSILEDMSIIKNDNIYEWAEQCNVSTATISRFTQKMGYKNFHELKSELNTATNNFSVLDQLAPIMMLGSYSNYTEAYSSLLIKHVQNFFNDINEERFNDIIDFIHRFSSIRIYTHGVDINQLVLQSSLFMLGKTSKCLRFEADQIKDIDNLDENTLVILVKPNVYEKNLTMDICKKLSSNHIPSLFITNSTRSVYIPFATKAYAFDGYMTQLDDPIFFLIISIITIKYREKYMKLLV